MSAPSLLSNPLVLCSALLILIGLISLIVVGARRRHARQLHTIARDTAIESMRDGLIVVDQAGRVVEYNPTAARLAALDRAAAGKPLAEAAHDRALGAVLDSMLAACAGPHERTIALQAPQARHLRVALAPLTDSSGRRCGALVTLRDLSEQLRSEEALARQSAGMAALGRIAADAGAAQDRASRLRAIVGAAREALDADQATIGLIDEARGQLTIAAESGGEPGGTMVGIAIPLGGAACEQLAAPIAIADPQDDQQPALARDLLARHDARSLLIVPLMTAGRLIGTLNLSSAAPRAFEPEEQALARTLAGYAAAAIAHAQLSDAAQQADRVKSAILDTVSHEFRTPITAILGFTELYQERVLGPVTEEQREALDAVHRNAHRLLRLVDDLLDLARLEAGKLDMSLYPVDIGLCIREATGLLAAQFQQKQLGLHLEIADALPLGWADAMWLRRVLVNLLTNALRYTSAGAITVRAYEALRPGDTTDAQRLTIEIEDTGRGIPEAEQELIFDAFQRAAGAQATFPTSSGAGLGLTISKRAIDQMEGRLALHSQPGRGSMFTITLHTAELALEHPHA